MTATAVLDGTAKPMPMEPPDGGNDRRVDADHFAVEIHQRTAELPGLMAASVWM